MGSPEPVFYWAPGAGAPGPAAPCFPLAFSRARSEGPARSLGSGGASPEAGERVAVAEFEREGGGGSGGGEGGEDVGLRGLRRQEAGALAQRAAHGARAPLCPQPLRLGRAALGA